MPMNHFINIWSRDPENYSKLNLIFKIFVIFQRYLTS